MCSVLHLDFDRAPGQNLQVSVAPPLSRTDTVHKCSSAVASPDRSGLFYRLIDTEQEANLTPSRDGGNLEMRTSPMMKTKKPFTLPRVVLLAALLVLLAVVPAMGAVGIDVIAAGDGTASSTTVNTSAFATNSANELLLAFVSADYLSGANTTVSSISGGSLTWVLVKRTNTQSGTSEIWRAFSTNLLSAVSVTATLSQKVVASITVVAFTGSDVSGTNGSGAVGATGR